MSIPVKIKLLTSTAKVPVRGTERATGYDIFADTVVDLGDRISVGTGIAVEPLPGWYTEVVSRSSIHKKGLSLANAVAVIDEDYRGEIKLLFYKIDKEDYIGIQEGERIAQMILRPKYEINFQEVQELDLTTRGENGFGSTGTN
jgi:dUTP pyrophosphatase